MVRTLVCLPRSLKQWLVSVKSKAHCYLLFLYNHTPCMVPEFRSYSAKKKEFRSYISKAPLGSATQTGELSYRVGSAATSTATASRQKGKRRPNIPRLGSAGRLACRPPGQWPSRAARRYFPFSPGRGARAEGQKPQIGLAGDTTLSYTTTDEEHVHDMSNDLTLLCE
jgi:hypothetical protein